jgi:hypothetical protein
VLFSNFGTILYIKHHGDDMDRKFSSAPGSNDLCDSFNDIDIRIYMAGKRANEKSKLLVSYFNVNVFTALVVYQTQNAFDSERITDQ